MRANVAPLTRTHPCQCGEDHPVAVMISGLPVVVCPKVDGPMLRLVFVKGAMPHLVTGAAPETLAERVRKLEERVAKVEQHGDTAKQAKRRVNKYAAEC